MEIKTFKVNEFLTLKLENRRTNIYVNGKLFTQCKYLLLNIPKDAIPELDFIDSIDEAEEILDGSLEGNFSRTRNLISSEVEFWAHCSNIQAWEENEYDTRILHRNLAFPLLKRLTEAGDPIARRVFREEIARRLASNHPTVIKYLINENFLGYLTEEEWEGLIDLIDFDLVRALVRENSFIDSSMSYSIYEQCNFIIDKYFYYDILDGETNDYLKVNQDYDIFMAIDLLMQKQLATSKRNYGALFIEKIEGDLLANIQENIVNTIFRNIVDRSNRYQSRAYKIFLNEFQDVLKKYGILFTFYDGEIFEVRSSRRYIDIGIQEHYIENKLVIYNREIKSISEIEGLKDLTLLEGLDLYYNNISEMDGLQSLPHLKILNLNHNNIHQITGLSNAQDMLELHLEYNYIKSIEGLESQQKLEHLSLGNNSISDLRGVRDLKNLEKLDLQNNKIKSLKGLEKLKNLRELQLNNNFISEIALLSNLTQLEVLDLSYNHISSLKPLEDLKNLRHLNLNGTRITDINALAELPNLKTIKISNTSISAIPDQFTDLNDLEEIELINCELDNFPNELIKKLICYSQKEIAEFERQFPSKNAIWSNNPTVTFKRWLWEKLLIKNHPKFDETDILQFEKETGKNAIWGFKPTKNFRKWLEQKNP
ncbi:MAG: leucine-rich repeat domain-containing protein [Promethearchaeia archaeon]